LLFTAKYSQVHLALVANESGRKSEEPTFQAVFSC